MWQKSSTLSSLFLLSVGLWCHQTNGSENTHSSEFEPNTATQDYFVSQRNRLLAHERQELHRKRVAIPDSVGPHVPLTPAAKRRLENAAHVQSSPAHTEVSRQILLSACILILLGILAIRKFAAEIGVYLNQRFAPWGQTPSEAMGYSQKIRAEDQAVSEFIAALQAGPLIPSLLLTTESVPAEQRRPFESFVSTAAKLLGEMRKLLQQISRG